MYREREIHIYIYIYIEREREREICIYFIYDNTKQQTSETGTPQGE